MRADELTTIPLCALAASCDRGGESSLLAVFGCFFLDEPSLYSSLLATTSFPSPKSSDGGQSAADASFSCRGDRLALLPREASRCATAASIEPCRGGITSPVLAGLAESQRRAGRRSLTGGFATILLVRASFSFVSTAFATMSPSLVDPHEESESKSGSGIVFVDCTGDCE